MNKYCNSRNRYNMNTCIDDGKCAWTWGGKCVENKVTSCVNNKNICEKRDVSGLLTECTSDRKCALAKINEKKVCVPNE